LFWDRKLGYGLTATLKGEDSEPQIQACAKCHARRDMIAGGYDAGDNYWDHYATTLLGRLTYHADGQIEDEDFEHGSYLQSKMYHKGIRCTDCHDPHSAKPKQEGNKLCTSCHQHPAGKYDTPLHHHHNEGGAGASCVACHMPTTTYMEVHARRDHRMGVPRPDLSVALGTPNACTGCHLDQEKLRGEVAAQGGKTKATELKQYLNFLQAARRGDATIKTELTRLDTWADKYVEEWYGQMPDRERDTKHYAYALAAGRQDDPEAGRLLAEVIKNRRLPAIVRASALEEWRHHIERTRGDSTAMLSVAQKQLDDADPMVRAAAVMCVAVSAEPRDRATLLAPRLHDEQFVVRRAAARGLADLAARMGFNDREAMRSVLRELVEGLMANNDRGGAYMSVGDLQLQLGDYAAAEIAYRQAILVEPNVVGARGQLASLLEALAADGVIPAQRAGVIDVEVRRLREEEFQLLKRDGERAPVIAVLQ
jgi:predicted CXXCH cytochrome family protein